MRDLTEQEIDEALDDNGEQDDGCRAIEATVDELAELGVGTGCGAIGNEAFKALAESGFGERKCRGWYDDQTKEAVGMFHVECNKNEAIRVGQIARDAEGSLRENGESRWLGFWEFEIE